MLRSVKYGFYGAVLAGVVGGTVAWGNVDKTVTLVVDGQTRQLHTTASRVSDILAGAGYHVSAHDLVAPAASARIHDGGTVIYKRGRLLYLDVNGVRVQVWTTAPTLSEALSQLGYSTDDFTSVSRAKRLALGPTDITLRTPRLVTVVHDGKKEQVVTTAATAAALLHDLGIAVGHQDRVSVAADSALTANLKIVVSRVRRTTLTATSAMPFPTTKQLDPKLEVGVTQIVTPGKDGAERITYAVVYVDGKMVGKTPIKTVVVTAPTPQVMRAGTKPSTGPPIIVTPGSAQAIAKTMAAARGWGNDQFACLVQIWDHESGWRTNAANPSGAYGIPQALPGSKMSSAGPNWETDAATQIRWGLGYIADRYHDPCNAWAIWQTQSWY